jgi:hypothetical protein
VWDVGWDVDVWDPFEGGGGVCGTGLGIRRCILEKLGLDAVLIHWGQRGSYLAGTL